MWASEGQMMASWFGAVSVKQFDAVGDNTTDDTSAIQAAIDYCFGSAEEPHGRTSAADNKVLFFPAGIYKITSPLILTGLHGPRIMGAQRMSTQIKNTAGGSVFKTNGMQYGHVSGLTLDCTTDGGGTCFDLDYDGAGTWNVALQSNTFSDMFFGGGDYGVEIGKTGFMGSENQFFNCFWINHAEAGLRTVNLNALQNQIWGGNFQGCKYGVNVVSGSVPLIHGVGFQTSTEYDIRMSNQTPYDHYHIAGCRTESNKFITCTHHRVHVTCCSQTGSGESTDVFFNGPNDAFATIENCSSKGGKVVLTRNTRSKISFSSFGREDWLDTSGTLGSAGSIEIEQVQYGSEFVNDATGIIARQRITSAGTFDYDVTAQA